ncbi:hypothetical protein RHMOL_Rhmol03G0141100 [Rhododendron molle]|uniref:Uncharacterized protein n=1 Tax=Rhododendron molle TaxID=49168 RepID=A0ACC0PF88_RHOML|nr:hypothetical protein RHMOL_Rhmol03G0141100 [Rhododendron molle]
MVIRLEREVDRVRGKERGKLLLNREGKSKEGGRATGRMEGRNCPQFRTPWNRLSGKAGPVILASTGVSGSRG